MSESRSILIVSHACARAVNRAPYAAMMDLGWTVTIVTVANINEAGRISSADPIDPEGPAIHLAELEGRNARTQRFSGLRGIIASARPNWVIADIDPHSLLAVELAALKRGLNFRLGFVTCENLRFDVRSLYARRGLRGAVLGLFCAVVRPWVRPRTDIVFAISSVGVALFVHARFARVIRTPLGFPDRFFRIDAEARSHVRSALQLHGPTIAYFGRLAQEKGVHVLFDALDRLGGASWNLLLDDFQVESSYQAELRVRIESSTWRDRVRLIVAKHGAVADYMNAADIVVVPSISSPNWVEQYGRVLPEALACGCRVIASAVGALPELMAGHGQLVPEGDSVALAAALDENLARVCSEPQRNTAGAEYSSFRLSAIAQAQLWSRELSL